MRNQISFANKILTEVHFKELEIKIPEPAAFVYNKFFTSDSRSIKEKAEKDIQTAKELLSILLNNNEQKDKLRKIFNDFPDGWKKTLRKIFSKYGVDINNLTAKAINVSVYKR